MHRAPPRLPLPRPGRLSVKQNRRAVPDWRVVQPWWTAVLFILGSTCFVLASVSRLSLSVSTSRTAFESFVLAPYFSGSLCYTAGCSLPIGCTFSAWQESKAFERRRLREGAVDAEVAKARKIIGWTKLDYLGTILATAGGLLVNFGCICDIRPETAIFHSKVSRGWQVVAPTMLGRAMFMLAGYFAWAARNRSWSLNIYSGSRQFWWTSLLFWLGAGLFYAGWFVTSSPFELAPRLLIKEWFGSMLGYVGGSCSLFAASYVMLLEVSEVPQPHAHKRLPS